MFGDIHNEFGERIDYTFHRGDEGRLDLAVIGHGVTGNKDREWAQRLAKVLTTRGIASMRISFSGNGSSEGRFEDSTISKEVGDLARVLDHCNGHRVAYIGHSMGGAVGVLAARQDPRIRWLVSLAGMVDTKSFAERKFGDLTPGRDVMWEKPECPLSQAFLDDMRQIGSVLEEAKQIEVPWMLVHGEDDTVVPVQDSLDVLNARRGGVHFVELEECDHVFSDGAAARMALEVASWLDRQMVQEA